MVKYIGEHEREYERWIIRKKYPNILMIKLF